MAKIIHEINVEVAKPNLFQAIVGKQSDYNSRFLKVTFVDGNEVISAAQSQSVTINANRPDGESKRFSGEINEDGTVTVPLSAWMLEIEGTVYCDISVIGKDDSKLTSTSFMVKVEAVACPDSEIADDEHFDVLQDLIADTEKALEGFVPFDGLTVKEYVDAESATHLKKPTTIGGNMIVTIMPNGATSTLSYHAYPAANTVAHRDGKGALRVADPTEDAHAATKKYVDDSRIDEWVDICNLTTTEDGVIDITTDADGNPFSLKKFYAIVWKSPKAGDTASNTLWAHATTDTIVGYKPIIQSHINLAGTSGVMNTVSAEIKRFWYAETRGGVNADGNVNVVLPNSGTHPYGVRPEMKNNEPITGIKFTWGYSGALPAGTKVEIWGVRA